MRLTAVVGTVGMLLWLAATPAGAQGVDDRAALGGMKEARVAFDITPGEAKRLLGVLNVIDEMRESLIKQGVTPRFVLTFRAGATTLIAPNPEKVKPEERDTVAKIAAKLKQLRGAPGVEGLEQCAVAMRLSEARAEHLSAEVKMVGNSWISLAAYQSRGYAYISP